MKSIIKRLFYKANQLTPTGRIELEISTRCTVKCPLCPRTRQLKMGDSSWNDGFLDKETILKVILAKDAKSVVMCGGYGDPLYHPDLIEIVDRCHKERPDLQLVIETNGGHRKSSWWEEMGKVTGPRHNFSYSIDGLRDTNPIYRVNADWDSIIEGVRVFRPLHRGTMQWKWILFSHNQHQVKEAYKFSKELGFDRFKLIDSRRHTEDTKPTLPFEEVQKQVECAKREWNESQI